jgi:alpha-L-fucosidase
VRLPAIPAKVLRSRMLTGGQAEVRQNAASLEITVPASDRQPIDTIVALELDTEANRIPPLRVPGRVSLTTKAKATASNVYQNQAQHGADKAVDGDGDTRWATDAGTKSAWLEVDLGKLATFNRVVIKQAYPELGRVRKFAIEALQGDAWKPCYEGGKLGAKLDAKFPPVTAQRVRLNFLETTDGPTIWEFQLFEPSK